MGDPVEGLDKALHIFRALLYEAWVEVTEEGKVASDAAFHRRPQKDNDGMSVHRGDRCLSHELPGKFKYPIFGAAQLIVKDVQSIKSIHGYLNVEQDLIKPEGSHAIITNVPYWDSDEETLASAEYVASTLSKYSVYVSTDSIPSTDTPN